MLDCGDFNVANHKCPAAHVRFFNQTQNKGGADETTLFLDDTCAAALAVASEAQCRAACYRMGAWCSARTLSDASSMPSV